MAVGVAVGVAAGMSMHICDAGRQPHLVDAGEDAAALGKVAGVDKFEIVVAVVLRIQLALVRVGESALAHDEAHERLAVLRRSRRFVGTTDPLARVWRARIGYDPEDEQARRCSRGCTFSPRDPPSPPPSFCSTAQAPRECGGTLNDLGLGADQLPRRV